MQRARGWRPYSLPKFVESKPERPDNTRVVDMMCSRALGVGAVLAFTLVGCDAQEPADAKVRHAELPQAHDLTSSERVDAKVQALLKPVRGKIVGGEAVSRTVRWPRSASTRADIVAALPEASRLMIARAPAPVLLPNKDEGLWLSAGKMHVGPVWWSYESHVGDSTLSISASTQARLYANIKAPEQMPHTLRAQPGMVTHNEGVWSMTWFENGVSYALDLECGAGSQDCVDESRARGLVESLVFVGGVGPRGVAEEGGA